MKFCRICKSEHVPLAFDFNQQPIVHDLLSSRNDKSNKFYFNIGICSECGFLQMLEYVTPEKLYTNYFTVSSWKPQPHATTFLRNIKQIFGITRKSRVFEIGSNDGGFLDLLYSQGFENILGIEPTEDAFQAAIKKQRPTMRGFYGLNTINEIINIFPEPDLIVSRQVIEHIPDLDGFMCSVKEHLKPGGALALELPDHSMNYEELDYSFWEEHVNYFTINTIRNLLFRHGFDIVHYESALFSGKCLFVYAVNSHNIEQKPINTDKEIAQLYIKKFPKFKSELHQFLAEKTMRRQAILYGCGARSCNFVNLLGIGHYFSRFIDDQIEKQNKVVPGCLLSVTDSSNLEEDDYVALGVNTEYEYRVIQKHGLKNAFSISPPSGLLPIFWRNLQRA